MGLTENILGYASLFLQRFSWVLSFYRDLYYVVPRKKFEQTESKKSVINCV